MSAPDKMEEDAVYGFDYLVSLGFDSKNIVIIGRSIGVGVAFSLAAKRKAGALITVSSFTSIDTEIQKLTRGSIPGWTKIFDNLLRSQDVDMPTLLIHGYDDQIFSFEESRLL